MMEGSASVRFTVHAWDRWGQQHGFCFSFVIDFIILIAFLLIPLQTSIFFWSVSFGYGISLWHQHSTRQPCFMFVYMFYFSPSHICLLCKTKRAIITSCKTFPHRSGIDKKKSHGGRGLGGQNLVGWLGGLGCVLFAGWAVFIKLSRLAG